MRRFHHGHSAALGFLLAFALMRHAITVGVVVFVVGIAVGRGWLFWKQAASAGMEWLRHRPVTVRDRRW